jgi:hypothetical protein
MALMTGLQAEVATVVALADAILAVIGHRGEDEVVVVPSSLPWTSILERVSGA